MLNHIFQRDKNKHISIIYYYYSTQSDEHALLVDNLNVLGNNGLFFIHTS